MELDKGEVDVGKQNRGVEKDKSGRRFWGVGSEVKKSSFERN